jgi:anti-sigma factor RsiW
MTCADVAELVDAFVDAELPGPTLLAVARHAGTCPACDSTLREVTSLHETVEHVVKTDADGLDLSGVWPSVAQRIGGIDSRRTWLRRARSAPALGFALAAAAAAAFWIVASPVPVHVAARIRPNNAVIERLASDGARTEIRRERKNGTVAILVSADASEAAP